MQTIFNYDRCTGCYTGAGTADPDPLEPGRFLIPAFATPKPVPVVGAGQQAVFNASGDEWEVVAVAPAVEPAVAPVLDLAARLQALQVSMARLQQENAALLAMVETSQPAADAVELAVGAAEPQAPAASEPAAAEPSEHQQEEA